ncbi:hypothetical protein FOA52_010807 [Chlamydomonas sp. UWO 241]|nr:hypothetical protein FOA52_010807 [Chlamydomonas sp. UWO 241]
MAIKVRCTALLLLALALAALMTRSCECRQLQADDGTDGPTTLPSDGPTSLSSDGPTTLPSESDCPSNGVRLFLRCDIEGNDIDCGNKDYYGNKVPYCELNNGLAAAVEACSRNDDCKAVASGDNGYSFYLKSKSAPCTYREDWMLVVPDK